MRSPAERGYLLINEMSDHLPIYVWGRAAQGALRLAGSGYGLGATMHADSLPEAHRHPARRPRRDRCRPCRPDGLPAVVGVPDAGRHVPPRRGGVAPAPRRAREAGTGPPGRHRGRALALADRCAAPARAAVPARRRRPRPSRHWCTIPLPTPSWRRAWTASPPPSRRSWRIGPPSSPRWPSAAPATP